MTAADKGNPEESESLAGHPSTSSGWADGGSGGPPTVLPAQAGIRRPLDGKGLAFSVPFGIPAYAGM